MAAILCHDETMKPHTEMVEGPEALGRFEDTMKALFSTPKPNTSVIKETPKPAPQKKASKKQG